MTPTSLQFTPELLNRLRQAVDDTGWLLSRGYSDRAIMKLTGDRYQLEMIYRKAVLRCAASDTERATRKHRQVAPEDIAGKTLVVDGFNVLITVQTGLIGEWVLVGRDGCYRDLAGLHRHGRFEAQLDAALAVIAQTLAPWQLKQVHWLFDAPVKKSGRLAQTLNAYAQARHLPWTAETVMDPDAILKKSPDVVASADGPVIERAKCWLNLARLVIDTHVPNAQIIAL